MRPLTKQQRRVLDFVDRHCRGHGFPPTLREIGDAIGLVNVNAVRGHVSALEKKGYISKDPEKARSIRVVHSPSGLSRFKQALHKVARTDEGVVHDVVYGLCLACAEGRRQFAGPAGGWLRHALARECVEHGWTIVEQRIQPDHLVLVLRVWPNHSPQLAVRRIRAAGEAVRRAHRAELPGRRLFAKGWAVTTDLTVLEEVVQQFLAGVQGRAKG